VTHFFCVKSFALLRFVVAFAHAWSAQVRPGGEPRAVGAKDDKMLRLQLEVLVTSPLFLLETTMASLTFYRRSRMRTGRCRVMILMVTTATAQVLPCVHASVYGSLILCFVPQQNLPNQQRRRRTVRAIQTTEVFINKQCFFSRSDHHCALLHAFTISLLKA
jgi:hypothetical protein